MKSRLEIEKEIEYLEEVIKSKRKSISGENVETSEKYIKHIKTLENYIKKLNWVLEE